jgi:hypothetical protein
MAVVGGGGPSGGSHVSQPDLFIAETALVHGLTVVSRDVSEYELAGIAVVSPGPTDWFRRSHHRTLLEEPRKPFSFSLAFGLSVESEPPGQNGFPGL